MASCIRRLMLGDDDQGPRVSTAVHGVSGFQDYREHALRSRPLCVLMARTAHVEAPRPGLDS